MSRENERKLSLDIGYRKKLVRTVIVFSIILAVVGVIFFKGYSNAADKYEAIIEELQLKISELEDQIMIYVKVDEEINLSLINSEIQDIGELATVEYLYTDVGKFEDPKQLFGKNIPFTTKSFIVKWDGVIKAGIDISKIEIEENKMKKEILIRIPEAEILSHEIDDESIETLDEKDGLFNPIKIDDVRTFDANTKDAMEQRAIENGLLERALANAKDIIYNIVHTDVVEKKEYSIVFEIIEKDNFSEQTTGENEDVDRGDDE